MKFIVTADIHEGVNFPYKVDIATGISARALDIHGNFIRACKYAIEKKTKLFVIAGDLFERPNVAPIFRELVRRDIIEPLGKAGIKVWIIAGNHDQPRNYERSSSIEDFRGYPHVEVFRKPCIRKIGEDYFIILPYLHPEQIVSWLEEKTGKEIPREKAYEVAQQTLKNWLERKAKECEGNKILLGHYYVQHHKLKLSETSYSVVLPGEFKLEPYALPKVNLAIFGHIHLHQSLRTSNAEIVYTGSVERIDWGEFSDAKGFLEVDTSGEYKFIELPCREMVKLSIEVKEKENPTAKILSLLPDLKEKLLRLEITLPEGKRKLVDEVEIARKLSEAFYYEIRWNETTEEKIGFAEYTMEPTELFKSFIELNYAEHEKKNEILKHGFEILNEVMR
ncbi:MAG: hypothetical protein DRN88_04955 [Candidatus Hydrothermarchaeota archaeon]|nr:MAG: hypothetical protein DRN88_04955 [Candidatus Hydrothermarchaeota archaeon]